jgi:hypothetical protein
MRPNWIAIAVAAVAALFVAGLTWLAGPFVALAIVLGVLVVVALFLLFLAKAPPGQRLAAKLGRRIGKTSAGRRMASAQLRAEAKRKGIATSDPFGRPLSDIELHLELVDNEETRAIKRQLKALPPAQRGQALRMMQRQAEEAARTGVPPQPMEMPARPGVSGRPITRPPRTSKRKKR